MTSQEVGEALKSVDTVIIPVGSNEVLGLHGPTGADHIVATEVGVRIAARANCLVAPTVPYGDAQELASWPGTVTIRSDVLQEFYLDICNSLCRHGAKRLVFFNTHMMNLRSVDYCGRCLRPQGIAVAQVAWWPAAFRVSGDVAEGRMHAFAHGGHVITSVVMALRPDLVDPSRAVPETPKSPLEFHSNYLPTTGGPFYTYPDFRDYCDTGSWGDATGATVEHGETVIDRAVSDIVDFLSAFRRQPLPEILT